PDPIDRGGALVLGQSDSRYALRSAICAVDRCVVTPWLLPPHAPKRSAIVVAQPLCMNGARAPTPSRLGTLNRPPVPTSTSTLLVSSSPAWHVAHPVWADSKIVLPRSTAVLSAIAPGAGVGIRSRNVASAAFWCGLTWPPPMRTTNTSSMRTSSEV